MTILFYPHETNEKIDFLAASINRKNNVQRVKVAENKWPEGYCFWNVALFVKEHGGDIVCGWIFREWPGVHLEAQHHAVWRNPETGDLLDISARTNEDENDGEFVVFLVDEFSKVNPDQAITLPSHFLAYYDSDFVKQYVDCRIKSDVFSGAMKVLAFKNGYKCEDLYSAALGNAPQPTPVKLDAVEVKLAEYLAEGISMNDSQIQPLVNKIETERPRKPVK